MINYMSKKKIKVMHPLYLETYTMDDDYELLTLPVVQWMMIMNY